MNAVRRVSDEQRSALRLAERAGENAREQCIDDDGAIEDAVQALESFELVEADAQLEVVENGVDVADVIVPVRNARQLILAAMEAQE